MSGAALALARALVAQNDGGFFFPTQASRLAPEVDWIFDFVLWVSAFFFVLVVTLMVIFVVRYRRRAGVPAATTATHSTKLELTWSIIPSLLLAAMFYVGVTGYLDMRTPPEDALEIQVTARRWSWSFTYANGHTDPELHVPLGEPVRLVMSSEDVIHSFFVPAFRLKQDVVPGRYTKTWFTATEVGTFPLLCSEYCGTKHSEMLANVVVQPPADFERWLRESDDLLATMPPAQAGEKLTANYGCKACHSIDGSPSVGPSWKGLFGRQVQLTDGKSVVADENYVRESIVDPQAKIVSGYAPVMPTFKGRIKDSEITAIIEYAKTLK